MAERPHTIASALVQWRKSLPLPVRRTYGWVKRHSHPHWLWDSRRFQDYFSFLQRSQWWSLAELEAYQLEQLQELVRFAYEKVPYYGRSFKSARVRPSDIKALDDLRLLPLISKEEVREHIDEFIPLGVEKDKLRLWVTGGTSGLPLSVYLDDFYSAMIEEAFSLRQRTWAGYRLYDRKATLQRAPMTTSGDRACWDYNNRENEIVLNSHEMSEENLQEFVRVLNEFRPLYLVGYPSALEVFGRYINRHGAGLPPIRAVFSGSEALFPGQRALVESAFNCKVFSGYGMSERVADATECERHSGYHVSMEYGILELLDATSEPVSQPGVAGTVVGTGFHNNVMPLIRYQMFDVAVLAGRACECQRQAPLIQAFRGRFREYFVAKSAKLVPLQLVWSGRHPVWSKIREMQFFQQHPGKVLARMVRAPKYPDGEVARELKGEVTKVLAEPEFEVAFEFVESLPHTHRGKLSCLDQKIPIDFEDITNAGP